MSDVPEPSIWRETGRALGGALIFSLPILMTMEMWSLSAAMPAWRLALMILLSIPLLVALARVVGIEERHGLRNSVLDALFALGMAMISSALILLLFGVLGPDMSADEMLGKVAIQTVPAAIGALLARSQLGGSDRDELEGDETYRGELFLMAIGALFLGFNVAPTEEMVLISYQMTEMHAVTLIVLSVAAMHGFVFAVEFKGGSQLSPETPWWSAFLRFTLPGYAIASLISLVLLWLFGRLDGSSLEMTLMAIVVLAFPCSIGAAAARLIL